MTIQELTSQFKEIYSLVLHTMNGPIVYDIYSNDNKQYYTLITNGSTLQGISNPDILEGIQIPDFHNKSFSFYISDFEISRYDSEHVFLETLAELKNSIQLSRDQLDMLLQVIIEAKNENS